MSVIARRLKKNRPEAVLNSKVHARSSAAHQGFKATAIPHQLLLEAAVVDGEIAAQRIARNGLGMDYPGGSNIILVGAAVEL